eukprot:433504-Amphidinium_carterae.2
MKWRRYQAFEFCVKGFAGHVCWNGMSRPFERFWHSLCRAAQDWRTRLLHLIHPRADGLQCQRTRVGIELCLEEDTIVTAAPWSLHVA